MKTARPTIGTSGCSGDRHERSLEWQQSLDAFAEFQRRHRGTCDVTIRNHLRVLRRFGEHASVAGAPVRPSEITTRHIDEFLVGHARPLGRNYTRQVSCSIRVFMRYLAFLGEVPTERPTQVPTVKIYRLAGLPRGLDQDDLRRVLRDVQRRDVRGRRQYAMLMLLASYGLRASDVAALRLDDLRWRDVLLWIRTVKTGRPLVLPLTDAVGDALADYLRDRPRTNHRDVFLSLRAPYHPLVSLRVSKIVREALDHAGVVVPKGVAAHALRHGFATRLVRNGVTLDVVAKCLGHATSATTEIYTKLCIEDLRSVSLDPRVVLS
jgi:site-specific recombinase XerD